MDRLSSELILGIFRNLDCQDRFSLMRVSKHWYQIVEENKSLWRRLVTLKVRKSESDLPLLFKFDEKSGSTLQEVSIFLEIKTEREDEVAKILQVLEKSKDTLQKVILEDCSSARESSLEFLNGLIWRLPHLVDCKIKSILWTSRVQFKELGGNEVATECSENLSNLRVLWCSLKDFTFTLDPQFLKNLASLWLKRTLEELVLRKLLDKASHTLKHLSIYPTNHEQNLSISPLQFPRLQVLEISLGLDSKLWSWLLILTTTKLIVLSHRLPLNLPSVSALWLSQEPFSGRLPQRCPLLQTLRLSQLHLSYALTSELEEDLLVMLELGR